MRRLSVRLVLSHLAVAFVALIAAYVVVRVLAPVLFDQSLRLGQGPNMSPGQGGLGGPANQSAQGGMGLRNQVSAAVDQAVLAGIVVGAVAATLLGALLGWRLALPLQAVRDATRQIAGGHYETAIPAPSTTELAELAEDVSRLGHTLSKTETRRLRLLGEVAHEMRTPITVIDGTVEAMIDGVMPAGPDELAVVSGEVRRLRRLSDDLSELSRADEGRLGVTMTRGDLGGVVAAAADRLRPQAEDAGLSLRVEAEALMASFDADRVAQVVTNLVGNAIRATPDGGTVRVSCHRDGEWAAVAVEDSGVGLAADDLERVFERFYRAHAVPRDGGSGIGLTIARRIAEAHGGTLAATSPGPGRGARFVARLPLSH